MMIIPFPPCQCRKLQISKHIYMVMLQHDNVSIYSHREEITSSCQPQLSPESAEHNVASFLNLYNGYIRLDPTAQRDQLRTMGPHSCPDPVRDHEN